MVLRMMVRLLRDRRIIHKLLRPLVFLQTPCLEANHCTQRGNKNDETSFTILNKSYMRFGEEGGFCDWLK